MRPSFSALFAAIIAVATICTSGHAQTLTQLCTPKITNNIVVDSPAQRDAAAGIAEPPLTDTFDWPDTPMGVIKTATGYEFFASDGGFHGRQTFEGRTVGNNKWGSVVTTAGQLWNPLGTAAPQDVSISPNPDPSVNPNYPSYTYMGGGPVYQVPEGMPGAGNLLLTYHAEFPNDALYAALGLAASSDNGLHWTDLGEIIRLNQAYQVGLDGFEIGDGPLVLSPDGKYFYLYFPDWMANGTPHSTTTTNVSVARAPVAALLEAAFGSTRQHTVVFQKFYRGSWDLQPGIGGESTDLNPIAILGISRHPLQQRSQALRDDHLERHHVRVLGIHRRAALDRPDCPGRFRSHRGLSHVGRPGRRPARPRQDFLHLLHAFADRRHRLDQRRAAPPDPDLPVVCEASARAGAPFLARPLREKWGLFSRTHPARCAGSKMAARAVQRRNSLAGGVSRVSEDPTRVPKGVCVVANSPRKKWSAKWLH